MLGAVAWWVLRNWVEVQEWFGFGVGGVGGVGQSPASVVAVPAPTRGWVEDLGVGLGLGDWRGVVGLGGWRGVVGLGG